MSLNDYIRVDDEDDVMAEHVNIPTVSTMRGELGEALAITSELALEDGDYPYLKLTPNADLDVLLPPEASTNHVHVIENGSGSYTLTVKDDSDSTVIATVGPLGVAMFLPSLGTSWKVIQNVTIPDAVGRIHTMMDGLKLTWNSATSITVGIGACYAANGDWIDVSSAITKAALSLSSSTWYHIYVYLSGGTPAAEVVTTAPVAWKGTAHSKTGDTSRRYVGSIKTDGSGNVFKFLHNPLNEMMMYQKIQVTAAPFLVLNAGTSSTAAAVDCSGVVPVTGHSVMVHIAHNGNQNLRTSEDNSVGASQFSYVLSAGDTAPQRLFVTHVLDGNQDFWYAYAAAVGSGSASMYANGYYFSR